MLDWMTATLTLALSAAPWLVFGLLMAGLIKAWLPAMGLARHLGGRGVVTIGKAALVGAPLPLCSCGVLPAAFELRRQGASKGSTAAFLVSTPETGVDSVALSWVLLGPVLAVFRPLAAIVSAIATGLLVERTTPDGPRPTTQPAPTCCSHSHHHHDHEPKMTTVGGTRRTADGVRYAFSALLDDLAGWLALGLLLAGLVTTAVPPEALAAWGSGPVAMVLMLLISAPLYVCATASTPLAHAMLHAGVSPGTVLVFLLAGPATNLAGMLLIRRELGTATLMAYLVGVCASALLLGLALDLVWPWMGTDILTSHIHEGGHSHSLPRWMEATSLVLLTACALRPSRWLAWRPRATTRS